MSTWQGTAGTSIVFHTCEERDRMLEGGMKQGLDESYAALDRLLDSQR